MGRPTATAEQNAAIRALVRAIVRDDYQVHQSNAAAALGLTKAGLGKFIAGKTGYGESLRRGLEKYLRVLFDEMLASGGDLGALRAGKAAKRDAVEVTFNALPSWSTLVAGAKALDATIPLWVWDELGPARVWVAQPVNAGMLVDAARFILKHVPPPPSAQSAPK